MGHPPIAIARTGDFMRSVKILIFTCLFAAVSWAEEPTPRIPLRVGLTIVTAISDHLGDYESIKRIESEDGGNLRLKYSSERPKPKDMFDDPSTNAPRPFVSTTTYRNIRKKDLEDSHSYLQQFAAPPLVPETFPGTTAVGVSAAVLTELKTKGESQLTVYQAPALTPLKVNRQPGEMDYRLTATIKRIERTPVTVPVIVNGKLTRLPAIHAKGQFVFDAGEFYFLDDPQNSLTLRFVIGKGVLNVIKVDFPGDTELVSSSADAEKGKVTASAGANIEQSLTKAGHVDVYGIYFSFNSETIRDESKPVLNEIAAILARHPNWKLNVGGHTDNVGGDNFNQDLSNRRAAAVKKALVEQYRITPGRLTTAGYGASHPKATNTTLEGRALNRRVELVRQ